MMTTRRHTSRAGNPAPRYDRRRARPRTGARTVAHTVAYRAIALSTALWLGACAVGPDYQTPVLSLPAHWGSEAAAQPAKAPALSQWWHNLGDDTLTALIEEAVEGNLDVATAKAKIREARASYDQSHGSLFPSIDASASATRQKSASATSGSGSGKISNQFQAGFDASWELDLFGGNKRGVEAAGYGIEAADEELRAALLTLVGDVASNYVEARGYQARIAYARRTAESQRQTESLTRVKFETGASSGVDVANAAGQASGTEANIPSLETSFAAAVHRLSVLTGRAPAALVARMKADAPIPAPTAPIPTGVPAGILQSRPDVRLAERQLAQQTALIGEAEAARYPSISLTGSVATAGVNVADLAKSTSISWAFGPTLSLPIFNAGELAAAVRVAEAQRDQSFIAFKASVLTALEDVENAATSLTQERNRYQKLDASAQSYREAARLARTLYQAGSSSFLDVLDAERSLYSAEDTLIQSRVAIATDYIALNKALGGGWDGAVDASSPEIVDTNTGPHLISNKPAKP
jgi:outer membrane protein, multidrug efflux system